MDPGDDHELRLLHARRRWLLSERRGLRANWNEAEYSWLRERIDELEMAQAFGLQYQRRALIFRLRVRVFRLLVDEGNRLLSLPVTSEQ